MILVSRYPGMKPAISLCFGQATTTGARIKLKSQFLAMRFAQ
jgi:hypothetical protein